jgi:sulfite exporter TauE/SafE
MSLLPGITNPYFEALALGLSYGLVFCTSACLPYVASYIAGIGAGFRKGVLVTLIYNSGRITAYAIIGVAMGLFKLIIGSEMLSSFQVYSSFAFGIVTIAVGASVLLRNRPKQQSCSQCTSQGTANFALKRLNEKFDIRAFSLGLSRGLIICPPLLLLLVTYSAAFAAPLESFALAILFGIGTAISPILLIGGVTGWLLAKAPLLRKWISILGGVFLILLGLSSLVNSVLVT